MNTKKYIATLTDNRTGLKLKIPLRACTLVQALSIVEMRMVRILNTYTEVSIKVADIQ